MVHIIFFYTLLYYKKCRCEGYYSSFGEAVFLFFLIFILIFNITGGIAIISKLIIAFIRHWSEISGVYFALQITTQKEVWVIISVDLDGQFLLFDKDLLSIFAGEVNRLIQRPV